MPVAVHQFTKLLVANPSEIAIRVFRSAHESAQREAEHGSRLGVERLILPEVCRPVHPFA